MRLAIEQMARRAVDYTFKREQGRYWAFVFSPKRGSPFYCSDGELTSPACKRVIGYAISQRWINGPRELLFDRGLDAGHLDSYFWALLRNEKDEVVRVNLE